MHSHCSLESLPPQKHMRPFSFPHERHQRRPQWSSMVLDCAQRGMKNNAEKSLKCTARNRLFSNYRLPTTSSTAATAVQLVVSSATLSIEHRNTPYVCGKRASSKTKKCSLSSDRPSPGTSSAFCWPDWWKSALKWVVDVGHHRRATRICYWWSVRWTS